MGFADCFSAVWLFVGVSAGGVGGAPGAAGGVLAGAPGAHRMAKPFHETLMPQTVQAVLAARIDRLPAEEKRLLQTASVIGTDVPFSLLQAVAELPDDVLRRCLAHLQAGEFLYEILYETSLFPSVEYMFKHALTHEVAYTSLVQERRRVLHGRIVHAFEALYPDRLGQHVERVAHHALRGRLWDRAVRYLTESGVKAAARSAHREAIEYFEQALETIGQLPKTRSTLERALDIRIALGPSLIALVGGPAPEVEQSRMASSFSKSSMICATAWTTRRDVSRSCGGCGTRPSPRGDTRQLPSGGSGCWSSPRAGRIPTSCWRLTTRCGPRSMPWGSRRSRSRIWSRL